MQKGLGADRKGLELAKFEYFNDASQTTKSYVELRVVPVILDRYFGKKTNEYAAGGNPASWASAEYEHQFMYFPIHSQSGFAFLLNNLGSEVSNVKTTYGVFNPNDRNLYWNIDNHHNWFDFTTLRKYLGSSFQWQRMADGHELIDWMKVNVTTYGNNNFNMGNGTPLPVTSFKGTIAYNDVPGGFPNWLDAKTNKVIVRGSSTTMGENSWVHDMDNPDSNTTPDHPDLQHWMPDGANMPCPIGYKIIDVDIDKFYMDSTYGYDFDNPTNYNSGAVDQNGLVRQPWFSTISAVTEGGRIIVNYKEIYNYFTPDNGIEIDYNQYAYPSFKTHKPHYNIGTAANSIKLDVDKYINLGHDSMLLSNSYSNPSILGSPTNYQMEEMGLQRNYGTTVRCVQGH